MKVCVTGGAGYLGSSLVKQLLERGYSVNATLRNLKEASKVELLKGLPYADSRLLLFQADIYNPQDFALAIAGCEVVFHLATPLQHTPTNAHQYKNTSEAAVAGVKSVAESCIRSGTVKRLIYTASVVAASALKDDGTAYKDLMDETCWTPLNISYAYATDLLIAYTHSKTLAEKEVLKYNGDKLEVVSLACGLVGGDTVLSRIPDSVAVLISQTMNNIMNGDDMHKKLYETLRFLEDLIGKVPILHVEDVTAAHIFSMENSIVNGRYLCASAFLKTVEIASSLQQCHPSIKIGDGFIEDTMREISWGSSKLEEVGFEYKYDVKQIMNDSFRCAKRICNFI